MFAHIGLKFGAWSPRITEKEAAGTEIVIEIYCGEG